MTQFDWGNPHVWINFEAKNDKGDVEKWAAGGPSPSRMAGTGWDKETLKPGDQITAVGHRITDGTYSLRLVKVVLSNGRELICYGGRTDGRTDFHYFERIDSIGLTFQPSAAKTE